MIKMLGNEYDGYLSLNQDETLTVVLHTWQGFEDLASAVTSVKSIENVKDGKSTVYNVTAPLAARVVGLNLYAFDFTTKLAPTEEVLKKVAEQTTIIEEQAATIRELSDTIDQLLVDSLEG